MKIIPCHFSMKCKKRVNLLFDVPYAGTFYIKWFNYIWFNYYIKSNGIKKKFINIDKSDELELFKYQNNNEEILLIGNFKPMFKDNYTIIEDNIFYHNPYVNRMWSQIETYKIINEDRAKN